jgi:hypothetical protein
MNAAEKLNDRIQRDAEERYRRAVQRTANRLRDLAEEIERDGMRVRKTKLPDGTEVPDYGNAARDVVHAVQWGVANAHADRVVDAAVSADFAFRHPLQGGPEG